MPLFGWTKSRVNRPSKPLECATDVYDLSQVELQLQKQIIGQQYVNLVASIIESTQLYEVVVKKDNEGFSIYRSIDRELATKFYEEKSAILNVLLPESPLGTDAPSMAKFLHEVLLVIEMHPTWLPVHVGAQMKMTSLFQGKNQQIADTINEFRRPLKFTALMIAIQTEHMETVRAILALNAQLDIKDKKRNTALHFAAMSTTAILRELIKVCTTKHGYALMRQKNKYGLTPLHLACYTERYLNVAEFLAFGLPSDLLILPPPDRQPAGELATESSVRVDTNDEKIVTFDKQMLDDLDYDDLKLGGTPLHWCRYRRTMDKLYQFNFPIDEVNFNKETVVHVMARKNRLMCLISALVKQAPVNNLARAGYSALHYAIKYADISAVQAVVVFDADVNLESKKKESARHIASTQQKEISEARVKLYVLNAIGARRCSKDALNCLEGCSATGQDNGNPYQLWPPLDREQLYEKYILDNIVQAAKERKLKDKQQSSPDNQVNMLCIDGGGVKGLIVIQMLLELEKRLNKPIHEHFKWVAGTSTGSFIAAAICQKKNLREIRAFYCLMKDNILTGSKPYPSGPIDEFLKSTLGKETKMVDIKDNKLVVTAVLLDRSPSQLHLFRSFESPKDILGQFEPSPEGFSTLPKTNDVNLWEAVRSSAAAPLYFSPHGPFVDGGLISNNPTIDTMTEFFTRNAALEKAGRHDELEQLSVILSMGTGRWPIVPCEVLDASKISSPTGLVKQMRNKWSITATLGYIVTQADHYITDRVQSWCRSISVPYFRISPPLSEQLPLDVTEDTELINALWEAKSYAYKLNESFDLLAILLEGSNAKVSTGSSNSG
ncbi:85/88 kDa calcium-independent phospholipase A2 [Halotydeus destructor]|nr:85/88 kDa calcium-independent phospholipase A2 [Halotydeus destructor]